MTYRYWDACVFLGWLKEEPDKIAQCMAGIRAAERGELVIVTSALSLAEVLYLVKGEMPVSRETRQKVRSFFENEYILLCEVDRAVGERAQDVVWEHSVKHKDAIHVATALLVRERLAIEQLDTYDGPLGQLSGQIDGLPIGQPNFQSDIESEIAVHESNGLGAQAADASLEGEVSP